MNKRRSAMLSSNEWKSFIYMASSGVVFLLAFLINIILTNYGTGSEVYGQYKYATNFILTIPALFGLGLNWSCATLISKETIKNKDTIITLSILFVITISALITGGLYFLQIVTTYFENPLFSDVIVVFPFVLVFMLQLLINQIYSGQGEATQLSIFNMIPNIIVL